MDFYSQPLRSALLEDTTERRKNPRKRLTQRVTLGLNQAEIVQGQTIEISAGGVAVMLHRPLAIGQVCRIRFDMFVNGESLRVAGTAKVMSCILSGLAGFRIGMQLTLRDSHVVNAIEAYVG